MCGIAGALDLTPGATPPDVLRRMTATLGHRGPDGEGTWSDGRVSLGMRRLAVIDLSADAAQPMTNEDGSLRLVFNGEIYNFQTLRDHLVRKGHGFRSRSDTETILHLYEDHGVDCVHHLRGMFAFALWDAPRRTLLLARDRLGKKPLFYYAGGDVFLFASEPKAMLQHPRLAAEAEPEALHHFLTFGYVPGPTSAFRGVRKLPPAHCLVLRDGRPSLSRYWSLRYHPKHTASEAALAEELDARLEDAVRLRLISDVPLGALLSGGIDSSAIVALARRLSSGRLKTFTAGFEQPEYDELAFARRVAEHLGTEHHELVVKPDAAAILPRLVWHYGEPFADPSAVPSMAIAELTRQFVTVALNGDGGDESFLGYDRYRAVALARWQDRVPVAARRALAGAVARLPSGAPRSALHRARRFAQALPLTPRRRYGRWMTVFDDAQKASLYTADFAARVAGVDCLARLDAAYDASDAESIVEATAHADVQLYLPDDLLVKMDIASMAYSLEVRSPFLDHEVVEFAARLPLALKQRRGRGKHLLRKVAGGLLPPEILRRPKMGFGAPIDHWFRHELREMARDVLLAERARARGYFRPDGVRRLLEEHVAGRAHHHFRLWALLVLELWHRTFVDGPCPPRAPLRCD